MSGLEVINEELKRLHESFTLAGPGLLRERIMSEIERLNLFLTTGTFVTYAPDTSQEEYAGERDTLLRQDIADLQVLLAGVMSSSRAAEGEDGESYAKWVAKADKHLQRIRPAVQATQETSAAQASKETKGDSNG
jgi:hypothetical protein